MIKYLTLTLFLLFTTRLPLEATPYKAASKPRIQVLPTGVHTYVWERPDSADDIELRLVIPVGLVHEKEGEAGAVYTLANQMVFLTRLFHGSQPSLLGQIECYEMWDDVDRLDTTYFDVSIPHDKLYLLPKVIELFATWAWKWDPTIQNLYQNQCFCSGNDQNELAIYAGRESFESPTSRPDEKTLSEFYNRTYRSLPIAVVAVGAFDPDWVESLIAEAFSSTPSGDLGPLPSTTPRETWLNQVSVTPRYYHSVGEAWVEIYLPLLSVEKLASREQVTNGFLLHILNKRLAKAFNWKEDELKIDGFLIRPTKACAFDGIDLECSPSEIISACALLDAELKKIALEGPSREELEQARTSIYTLLLESKEGTYFDSTDHLSLALADSCIDHFRGTAPLPNDELGEGVQKVIATMTLDDVQTLAKSLKPLNQGRVSVSLPRNEDAEAIRAQLKELFQQNDFPF